MARHRSIARPTRRDREHQPGECTDPDCPRYPCRIYRQGFADGRAQGHAAGVAEGEAGGYVAGYAAGAAARGR